VTTHLSTGEVEDVDLYLHTPYAFRACKGMSVLPTSIQNISHEKKSQGANDIANNPTR